MIPDDIGRDRNLTIDDEEPKAEARHLSSRGRRLDRTIVDFMRDGYYHDVSELRDVFPGTSRQQLTGSLLRLRSKGLVVSDPGDGFRVYRLTQRGPEGP